MCCLKRCAVVAGREKRRPSLLMCLTSDAEGERRLSKVAMAEDIRGSGHDKPFIDFLLTAPGRVGGVLLTVIL